MTAFYVRHQNWVVAIVGLLLIIDLRKLAWVSGASETIGGIVLTHSSSTATGSPSGWLGLLAVLAVLAALVDLVAERLATDMRLPSIGGSRPTTRYVLALGAATSLALKFILHIDGVSDLGIGFWLGAALAAAFVYCTAIARGRGTSMRSGATSAGVEAEGGGEPIRDCEPITTRGPTDRPPARD